MPLIKTDLSFHWCAFSLICYWFGIFIVFLLTFYSIVSLYYRILPTNYSKFMIYQNFASNLSFNVWLSVKEVNLAELRIFLFDKMKVICKSNIWLVMIELWVFIHSYAKRNIFPIQKLKSGNFSIIQKTLLDRTQLFI